MDLLGEVKYLDRGETIQYLLNGRYLYCDLTWVSGYSLFTDSIKRWGNSSEFLKTAERLEIIKAIICHLVVNDNELIIVIDEEDVDKENIIKLLDEYPLKDKKLIIEFDNEEKRNIHMEAYTEGLKCHNKQNLIKRILNAFRRRQ